MLKGAIATSPPNDVSNTVVQSFYDAAGNPVVEVVEKLRPPVASCSGELVELSDAAGFSLPNPGTEKAFRTLTVANLFANGVKGLLEQVSLT
jgi:hypothetical protein